MSYTLTTLAGAFRWSFPVFDYERHDPAPPHVKQLYAGWPHLPGGVFVGVGRPLKKNGISQERGAEVFTHASRVNTNDPDDVLTFVRRFGLLGCAEPQDAVQMFDSVFLSQKRLKSFQRLAARVRRLKADESASRDRWTRLLKAIQKELHVMSVQPGFEMRTDTTGRAQPAQVWRPRCLKDVLFLTLWQVSQAVDFGPRQCLRCDGLFFVTRRNSRKQYCSASCNNLARVNRHRQKKRSEARSAKAGRLKK
jgi:hypothetical protein